jgi:hypothetical protein
MQSSSRLGTILWRGNPTTVDGELDMDEFLFRAIDQTLINALAGQPRIKTTVPDDWSAGPSFGSIARDRMRAFCGTGFAVA